MLVGVLQLFIVRTRAYGVFRIDFIGGFALVVILRMLLPCEYIDTYTISSHKILPAIYGFLAHTRWTMGGVKVTWFIMLGVIWLIGAVIALTRLTWQAYHLDKTLGSLPRINAADLELAGPVQIPPRVKLYRINGVTSPFVSGLRHPKLILPSIAIEPTTLTYIMRHEVQHIKNRDVLLKYLISLLVCVYWWFPPMYIFRRQANMIIEMRVDNQIVQRAGKDDYYGYTQSLVTVTKQIQNAAKSPIAPALSAALLPQFTMFEQPTLTHRIKFLLTGRKVKRTNRFVLAMVVVLPLIVTSIIFEPDSINPAAAKGTFEINPKKDKIIEYRGKYYIWAEGKNQGWIKNPHVGILKKLPIEKH